MKRIELYILTTLFLVLGGCSNNKDINEQIIAYLDTNEININKQSINTAQLNNHELNQLYPKFEFYKSDVKTLYMEYPNLNLITLHDKKKNKVFILCSMSFKQMEPEFLDQFEQKRFESDLNKRKLLTGFSKLYEELEFESDINFIDSTDFNDIKFEIANKTDVKETFYLKFENKILVDFNLDFKGIPIRD